MGRLSTLRGFATRRDIPMISFAKCRYSNAFFKKYHDHYDPTTLRENNITLKNQFRPKIIGFFSIFTFAYAVLQRESIFKNFLLQTKELILYFSKSIDTWGRRDRVGDLDIGSKWC